MRLGPGLGLTAPANAGAGGAPFTPASLPGLALWLEADTGVTGSSPVTAWADQSAAGNSLTSVAGGATLTAGGGPNGLHSVDFAGAAILGRSGANLGTAATGQTLFLVWKTTVVASFQVAMSSSNPAGGAGGYSFAVDGNSQSERDLHVVGQAFVADAANSATTSWEAWAIVGGVGSQALRVNGAQRVTGAFTPGNDTGISLGGLSETFFLHGSVWGAFGYNRTLTGAEVAQVESYIRGKTLIW